MQILHQEAEPLSMHMTYVCDDLRVTISTNICELI
jgi:hypothetical protein